MNRLTKYEQETIVSWNRDEDTASVFTYEPALKRRLADYAKKHPDIARLEFTNDLGGASYILDKKRLSIRFTAPYDAGRRQKLSEYAKENGIHKK